MKSFTDYGDGAILGKGHGTDGSHLSNAFILRLIHFSAVRAKLVLKKKLSANIIKSAQLPNNAIMLFHTPTTKAGMLPALHITEWV